MSDRNKNNLINNDSRTGENIVVDYSNTENSGVISESLDNININAGGMNINTQNLTDNDDNNIATSQSLVELSPSADGEIQAVPDVMEDKPANYVRKLADPAEKAKVNKFDLVFIKIWSIIVSIVIGISNGINKFIHVLFKKKAPDKYIRAFVSAVLIILVIVLVTLPFKVVVNGEAVYEIYGDSLIPVRQRVSTDEQGFPVYKWGFANKKNQIKIDAVYEEALPFMHGSAWVRVVIEETNDSGKVYTQDYWKLIDKKGKDRGKIPQKFYYSTELGKDVRPVGNFTKDVKLAWIYTGSYGYIDYKGNMKVEPRYKYAEDFSEGFARVREGSSEFFINKNGKKMCSDYEEVKTFSYAMGAVKRNELWGFINAKGKLIIEPTYDDVSPFLGIYAAVRRGPNYGIIDNKGNVIVSPNMFNDLVALSPEFKLLIDSIRI